MTIGCRVAEQPLIRAEWTGEHFRPIGNWPVAWCQDHLDVGERVAFEIERDRSPNTHKHQFAWIKTAWENLPETEMAQPYARSPETLRKYALIATGHCEATTIDAGTKAAAERVAAFARAEGDKAHGVVIVSVRGPIVTRYAPLSQSYRAMGRERFQQSKSDILDWISARLGVEPRELGAAE